MEDFLLFVAPIRPKVSKTEKHLGGQHNQQAHAGGKGGASVSGDLAAAEAELAEAKRAVSQRMREAKASGDYSGMSQLRKKVATAQEVADKLRVQGSKAGEIGIDEPKMPPVVAPQPTVAVRPKRPPKDVRRDAVGSEVIAPTPKATEDSPSAGMNVEIALNRQKGKYNQANLDEDLSLADPRDLGARLDGKPMRLFIADNTRGTTDGQWNRMTDGLQLLIGKNTQRSTIRETLLHEIGHRAQYRRQHVNDPKWHKAADAAYERRVKADYVSNDPFGYPQDLYRSRGADVGRREFYAQAYATYKLRPDRLRELDRDIYDYFASEVFT